MVSSEQHDAAILAEAADFWRRHGFEPWSWRAMRGVRRRTTVAKDALLGPVAEYYVDDYVVWRHAGDEDAQFLLENWPPERDVMLHRFLFVGNEFAPRIRTRSFLLGLRGYIEVCHYQAAG
ncbi:MAG TPA: hypothetical protein HPP77_07350, partial [Candidatus Hydrogenedentes bacterium]|nr:hypothetical protein [Candidatus Hydrogenedentota bacterium]